MFTCVEVRAMQAQMSYRIIYSAKLVTGDTPYWEDRSKPSPVWAGTDDKDVGGDQKTITINTYDKGKFEVGKKYKLELTEFTQPQMCEDPQQIDESIPEPIIAESQAS